MDLPVSVVEKIISFLDLTNIASCACVCTTWRNASASVRAGVSQAPVVACAYDCEHALADAISRRTHCTVSVVDVSCNARMAPDGVIRALHKSGKQVHEIHAHALTRPWTPEDLDYASSMLSEVHVLSLVVDIEVLEQLPSNWQPPHFVCGSVRSLSLGRFASGERLLSLVAPSLNVSDGITQWADMASHCANEAVRRNRPIRLSAGGNSGNVNSFDEAAASVGAFSLELSMDPAAAAHALAAIPSGVVTLRLIGTALGNDDAYEIARRLEQRQLSTGECVRELDLQGSAMTWKGATRIVEALGGPNAKHCCSVEAIDLGQGMSGDPTAEAIAFACRRTGSKLRRVSLPRAHVGDYGCRRLASASEEGYITRLCLARNRISRIAVKALSRSLRMLEALDLSEVGLEDEDAYILAEDLKVAKQIKWLRIAGNKIGDEGAASLSSGVRAHCKRADTLRLLNMERNALQPDSGRGRYLLSKECTRGGVQWISSGSSHELKRYGGLQVEEQFGEITAAEHFERRALQLHERMLKVECV